MKVMKSSGIQVLAYALEIVELKLEVILDMAHGGYAAFLGGYEIVGGIDGYLVHFLYPRARHGVDDRDAFHLVPEELYAHGVVRSAEINVHSVAPYTEGASLELHFRTGIQGVHQLVKEPCKAALLALLHYDRLLVEVIGIADAVQAGYA